MFNRKRNLIYLTAVIAILIAISAYRLKKPHRVELKKIADINRRLSQAVKTKAHPAVSGAGSTRQVAVKPAKSTAEPTLTQEKLEPLRQIFSETRFYPSAGNLPKERAIVLSNRVIPVPAKRSYPAALSQNQSLTSRNTIPYIVHFGKPITPEMRRRLTKSGAIIKGYLPNYAFLTELTSASLRNLSANPDVDFVTEFTPKDKIHPFLTALSETNPKTETIHVALQTIEPQYVTKIASHIENSGGTVENINRLPEWGSITATLALNELPALAAMGEVQWIEEFVPAQLLNDFAAKPEHLNATTAWNSWYLTGRGQIIGHADTGIDSGDESTIHPDFKGQIAAIFDLSNGGSDAADYDGHGTHTAGSICGNGAASGGLHRGIAYEAKLVSQCIVDKDTGSFTGIGDLYGMYMQSYLAGATIHSDSWGSAVYGEYDSYSRTTDQFAWTHSDFLPVFAAGNSGKDLNNDGIVDSDSIASPGTAKNTLSVGATEGDRPFAMEGFLASTYYNKWPTSFKTDPIKNDYISRSATTSPYMQGMAAFSSRGPTDDNRLKPDLTAPGTDIISTRSSVSGAGWLWGILPSNPQYCYSGGTSMATPLTAGSAALIRQYMVERAGLDKPSAALIKAAMIGGARTLAPGQYGTNSTQEIPFTSPNNVEGWGQLDIVQAVHPSGMMIKLIDKISSDTGTTNIFEITVEKSGYPLDIVMCWSDYPGTAGGAVTLINDLNLNVVTPGTNTLYPNNGSVDDDRNTVESIRVNSADAGVYTVKVIGFNVPVSGGTAALYVRGAINEQPIIVHQAIPYYDSALAPYPVDFKVQSLNLLTNNELSVIYNTGTMSSVTGTWQSAAADWTSNANYQALIPQMPKNTTLHYYIKLTNDLFNVELPANASVSNEFFTMHLGTPVTLVVEGNPDEYGTVTPDYGTNTLLSGQVYTASAYPETVTATERLAPYNWSGTGDIPASGSANPLTNSIFQESTLTWNWETQYALTRKMYFKNLTSTVADGTTWHWKDMIVPDQSASDLINVTSGSYEELYAFYGWSLDGDRWPDSSSPSQNPLNGLVMSNAFTLQANYMELETDDDGDGLYDWWEIRIYGDTNATDDAEADTDNDSWTNLGESLDNTDPLDPASYPLPPVITVNPLDPFQSVRPPWTVKAEVTDNFILIAVILEWKEKGDATWQQVDMTYLGNSIFAADLNPPSHGAKRVDYRVTAYDLVGYYDNSFATVSPVYGVIGDYDTPWMSVEPVSLGLTEVALQPTNFNVTVSNLVGTDLVWTGVVASATQTFGTADPGWQHSGTNDVWNTSTYRTWNGEPVWYCGDNTTHLYPNSCHASLNTPPFTVGEHGVLIFRHWMDFEEYGSEKPGYYWDGAVIMISTNNGASFTTLEPVGGYNGYIEANPDSPFPGDLPCFGDTGSGWQTVLVDLAEYEGLNAVISFVFGSDKYTVDEGWYVGGVTVLSSDAPLPPWLTPTGSWNGILPDLWSDEMAFSVDPLLMETNSEDVVCLRVDSNDPSANPMVDLTVRRGFAVSSESTGFGSVSINDPIIFRSESSIVDIQADYGSYITNVTINGVFQPGDYAYKDTYREYITQPVTNNLHFAVDFTLRSWDLVINSAHGSPSPAAGYYYLRHGSNITATVTTPESDTNPMIRYSTDDFVLEGVDPVSYAAGELSFILTNHTTLTWLWTTNYQLNAVSTGNGVVVPGSAWYAAGSTGCTTGYPSLYYHLSSWSGETNGATLGNNSIDMPMDTPRTISAAFEANLTATHGVPEYWLASYGLTGDFESAAEDDQDSDRMATWKEWRSDTNPTDSNSLLQVSSLLTDGVTVQIDWIGGIMRTQILQSASEPSGPWTALYTNLPPTAVSNTLQLPYTATNSFYRIAVP